MNRRSFRDKYNNDIKAFTGIAESIGELIPPIHDLNPKRRGIIFSLGIGTVGIIALTYLHAPWYSFVAEVVLCISVAVLLGYKFRK